MSVLQPGTCRHCRCTEENACRLAHSDACCWIDNSRLVCSNPSCIKAEKVRVAKARAANAARLKAELPEGFDSWGEGAKRLWFERRARLARLKRQRGVGQ
jgi:hypothetical protein